ncbi:hypothetical protein AC1031_021967 [Aphanomyces cochlioides]|nr:hypothetical protein AC1031_021967 [Aphanomyces cochlioides]
MAEARFESLRLSRTRSSMYASSPIPQTNETPPPTTTVNSPLLLDPQRPRRPGTYVIRRDVLFGVCCVLTFAWSGGLILGFGPFYSTLVQSKQWHEKCPPGETGVCPTQEVFLQFVFSTSFLLLSAANVVFGLCIDIVGPRVAALVGLLIATIGNVCVAFGDSTVNDGIGIILGYGLIGMGGMGLFLSSFQVINLFENQGIPCSAMSSVFNLSGRSHLLSHLTHRSVHLHAPHHPRHNAVRFFWHICHFVRRGVRRVLYYVPRQEHPSSPRVHPRARFQLLRPNPEETNFTLGWIEKSSPHE